MGLAGAARAGAPVDGQRSVRCAAFGKGSRGCKVRMIPERKTCPINTRSPEKDWRRHQKGSMGGARAPQRNTKRGHSGRLNTYLRRARVILTVLDEYGCTGVEGPP